MAFREEHFAAVRKDVQSDFLRNQPEITDGDWDTRGRQVIGCEVHGFRGDDGFVDGFVLILHLHENGQEKIAIDPTLAPVLLGYLREIIEGAGMVDPAQVASDGEAGDGKDDAGRAEGS